MAEAAASLVLKHLFSMDEHVEQYDWQPFKDGVEIYPIYGEEKAGPAAALLRYKSGASVPKHTHTGYEHILILSGSQTDGNEVYERGTMLISTPGSRHWVASHDGCVVLAIWEAPVEFEAG